MTNDLVSPVGDSVGSWQGYLNSDLMPLWVDLAIDMVSIFIVQNNETRQNLRFVVVVVVVVLANLVVIYKYYVIRGC